jgi:hypothetical protein
MDTAEEDTWHYTKRPITRVENRISYEPRRIVWPPLPTLFPEMSDPMHTMTSLETDQKKVASSLTTFVRQFNGLEITEKEYLTADHFLKFCLRQSKLFYHDDKGFFVIEKSLNFPVSIDEGLDFGLWVDRLVSWRSVIRVPKRLVAVEETLVLGVPFEAYMSKPIKLACDLGYAVREQMFESILVADDPERFVRLMSLLERPVYTVVLSDTCPSWLTELIHSSSSLQEIDDAYLDDVLYGVVEDI